MQKSEANSVAASAHRRPQPSTTLNRKYVRPVDGFARSQAVKPHATQPIQTSSSLMPTMAKSEPSQPTAKELKDRAIEKALASAANVPDVPAKSKKAKRNSKKFHFGFGRVALALSCTAVAVAAIVYFVNLNMPDLSLRVAAMQTGIDASYPSYVPRDFSLSDITSENGKITLNFRNASTGSSFSLVEEQSSWDSNALLENFVKPEYGDNYTSVREQGLTIYQSGSNACWVNGGVVFKLTTTSGSLTKKQIKSIAVSL